MFIEDGNCKAGDKLRALKYSAVQAHKVVAIPPIFIVIGNFVTHEDSFTVQTINSESGLGTDAFDFVVREVANELNLPIKEHFDDSIVLEGTAEDLSSVKHALGLNFSYVHIDGASLEGLIRAEAEYKLKGYVLPGSEKPKTKNAKAPQFNT